MRKIDFSPPNIGEGEIKGVIDTLQSGWITTGPKTKLLEKKLAKYCNVSKAVAMNSATACLEMTLRLLGVGPGDEVITSAYTYTASASVIAHVGAKIVLVDTSPNSYEMDYDKLSENITEKTKVIIPVDIAGVMCNYEKLFSVVEDKKNLFKPSNDIQSAFNRVIVLADAAHSVGAQRNGKKSGEVADFTCFSFHAVKNLTTAEGGAVVWKDIEGLDNEDIYNEYMLLSLHGQSKDALSKMELGSWEYDIVGPYYKCNMTDILASIGLVQLHRYNETLNTRKKIIELYDKFLNMDKFHTLKHYGEAFSSSGHLYLVRILDKDESYRNSVIKKMAKKGISTNVHYKPLPMHTAYKKMGFNIEDYQNAYNMYKNEISLPLHTMLSDEDIEYVCNNLIEIIES